MDLFTELCYRLNQAPDRHGEVMVDCPSCGKPAKRGQVHFSFSERGSHCFVCGYSASLRQLAEHYGIVDGSPIVPRPLPPPPKPKPEPEWTRQAEFWRRYLPLPPIALDYCARRGLTRETAERWRLGWGVLPSSRCRLPRLIVPSFEDGHLVGLRGRAVLTEDTDAKWLTAGGSRAALWGGDELRVGAPLIITEAPLSAMLAMQEASDISAVAICSASTWREEWTERIRAARPESILVVLDNDAAGLAGGVRVVNDLLKAGLAARLYRWPRLTPEHADLADLVVAHRGAA